MRALITVLLVSLPVAAQAMGMHGGGCGPKSCGHLAIAIYAVIAVLGYLVLQRAYKESGVVKKTGGVIAWVLIIVGLLGVLCGVGSHIKGAMPDKCGGNCPSEIAGNGPDAEGAAKPSCPMHMEKGKTK